jgi:CDP-paratose 2-epimerase
VINRCGVIAGAGQFGKSEQGVVALWVANHAYGLPLRYIGFGGTGRQVRDILHPNDLFRLLMMQIEVAGSRGPEVLNVGGGPDVSVSLLELTGHCREVTGKEVQIGSEPATSAVDIPWYVSDCTRVGERFGWRPTIGPREIVEDIFTWIEASKQELAAVFAPEWRGQPQ